MGSCTGWRCGSACQLPRKTQGSVVGVRRNASGESDFV